MGLIVKVTTTSIAGVIVIESTVIADHRGAFTRLFCEQALCGILGARRIVQINHSRTNAVGAIRGMHYQKAPYAEMKLIRCLKGQVWDVVVDLRAHSPTFRQWHAEELSAENVRMIVIPEGCAHGYQVLERESELHYLHTAFYTPAAEGGVRDNDPFLGITWPLPATEISQRDLEHPFLSTTFKGLEL